MEKTEIESLKAEHDHLEDKLEEANSRAIPDNNHVSELKRRKLQIKDKIAALQTTYRAQSSTLGS